MKVTLNAGNIAGYLNDATIRSFVKTQATKLHGTVLDIGSGRQQYRTIVEQEGRRYVGIDLDPGKFAYSVVADLYWDGVRMDIPENAYDGALLLEVLEHCADPRIVVSEAFRVLRPGSTLIFSTPFLYPIHGAPYDFQRLSPYGAQTLLSDAGFTDVQITAGGSYDASLGQMIAIWIRNRPMPKLLRRILSKLYVPIFRLLLHMDKKWSALPPGTDGVMITGILGTARKPL